MTARPAVWTMRFMGLPNDLAFSGGAQAPAAATPGWAALSLRLPLANPTRERVFFHKPIGKDLLREPR
jgi:hypothetical protein